MRHLRRFCIYATICVATNFIVLATFFLGVFVLSERRMAANRLDCCCWKVSTRPSGFAADADMASAEKGALCCLPSFPALSECHVIRWRCMLK